MDHPNTVASSFHCVFEGWIPGIYTTVPEVDEVIQDYPNRSWKTYGNLADAGEAWILYFGRGDRATGLWRLENGQAPAPIEPDNHRAAHFRALRALQARFQEESDLPISTVLTVTEMVPPKPSKEPLVSCSMQRWLQEACDSLDIPNPIYRMISYTTADSRPIYRHLAAIVPPGSTEALVVGGRLAFHPDFSHQDAARLCLRRLTELRQAYIDDYHLDTMVSLKHQFAELARDYQMLEQTALQLKENQAKLREEMLQVENRQHRRADSGSSASGV